MKKIIINFLIGNLELIALSILLLFYMKLDAFSMKFWITLAIVSLCSAISNSYNIKLSELNDTDREEEK